MSILNWDKNFALEQVTDDAELLEELIAIFKESCTKDLAHLKNGLEAGDAEHVCAAAHSIKGAAASLGIIGIKDVATRIEKDSKGGSLKVAQDCYALLEALTSELMRL